MALSDQRHTFRFPLPHEIIYNRATTIQCPVYLDGALVSPSGGSGVDVINIYDETGTAIVSDEDVTVTSSIAEYQIAADTFAEADVSERVRVEWSLTVGGTLEVGENDGIVVRRDLHPTITAADLYRRYNSLDPSNADAITGAAAADHQQKLDEAWVRLINDMISDGTRPSWVMSPSSLRAAHVEMTLAMIFDDLASRLDPAYAEKAMRHERLYEAAYRKMTALLDLDDDGQVDYRGRQGVASSSLWLGRPTGGRY